jgi:hypothetical protein
VSRTIHDYESLERQYITSDVSIRALCEANGIRNWSTVHTQAKKREWERKRAAYKDKQFEHDIDQLARRRAMKLQQLSDDLIDVINATILKMAENLQSKDYIVTPQDLVKLIEKVSLLTGGPTSREEIHALNVGIDLPPELLRELQGAARANGAGVRTVGQSALPLPEGTRQVN